MLGLSGSDLIKTEVMDVCTGTHLNLYSEKKWTYKARTTQSSNGHREQKLLHVGTFYPQPCSFM